LNDPLIEGGYILLSRKIVESEIFKKPPLYLKVWVYLLASAQHKQYKQLDKGQLYTSIPEIQEACSYRIGFRKEIPTKDQIYNILEWLRKCCEGCNESNVKATMISTMKATHGMIVNIDKYTFYQNPKNYESNDESNNEKVMKAMRKQREPDNINKNEKNEKNEKNIIYKDIVEYLNQKSGSNFNPSTKTTQTFINARLKEGHTVEEFKIVIDKKVAEWKGNKEMEQYLRPQTLFGTKFESYLNQKESQPKNEPNRQHQSKSVNRFNQFPQRTYTAMDYQALEKALTQNQRSEDEE
jgi:uncharacterized phage protein (TIGR02220 family)